MARQASYAAVLKRLESIRRMFASRVASPKGVTRRDKYNFVGECWNQFEILVDIFQIRLRFTPATAGQALADVLALAETAALAWSDVQDAPSEVDSDTESMYTSQGFVWSNLEQLPEIVPFRFGTAALLYTFFGRSVSDTVRSLLPVFSHWKRCELYFRINFLDSALVESMLDLRQPRGWNAFLTEGLDDEEDDLRIQTYRNYMAIVTACTKGDVRAVETGIAHGFELYSARETDLTETFASWEGGGSFNRIGMDLRLASISRWSLSHLPNLELDIPSYYLEPIKEK